jgi:hypothetical protein
MHAWKMSLSVQRLSCYNAAYNRCINPVHRPASQAENGRSFDIYHDKKVSADHVRSILFQNQFLCRANCSVSVAGHSMLQSLLCI